jgi:hypothetical protein
MLISFHRRRSSLYMRSEIAYLLPAMRGIDSRRKCMLESLERSSYECGSPKQYSGYGTGTVRRKSSTDERAVPHIFRAYAEVDSVLANELVSVTTETFPIKRLYNMCNTYSNIWRPEKTKGVSKANSADEQGILRRGAFPYVDERATVLTELTKSVILQTRHRVNSDAHPRWALRTIRRRKRKVSLRYKKRSISQDTTRELQAKLLAEKHPKSKQRS